MSYTRYTFSCLECKREISSNNISKHINSKSCKLPSSIKNNSIICSHCYKETTQTAHEIFCKSNPNQRIRKPSNQYIKGNETGKPYIISDETRDKISFANIGRSHTPETIEKLKVSMRKAVEDNPDSYRGHYNRGYVKEMTCSNGFKVLGSWELLFVEFCVDNDIEITQPKIPIEYVFNGDRKYFPDFYLPEHELYVEVKGYETPKDIEKWKSLIELGFKLFIIEKEYIRQIKNKTFDISNLVQPV